MTIQLSSNCLNLHLSHLWTMYMIIDCISYLKFYLSTNKKYSENNLTPGPLGFSYRKMYGRFPETKKETKQREAVITR